MTKFSYQLRPEALSWDIADLPGRVEQPEETFEGYIGDWPSADLTLGYLRTEGDEALFEHPITGQTIRIPWTVIQRLVEELGSGEVE